MKLQIASLMVLVLALAAVPAKAQTDVYDNGPVNGQDLGFTLNFGFSVSDSFTSRQQRYRYRRLVLGLADSRRYPHQHRIPDWRGSVR